MNVLVQQPEVDPTRISIVGHSEGTQYAPRIAIDNSTKVKNIILMAALAQNPTKVVEYYQVVYLPLQYAMQVLDKNHTGVISIQQIAKDPFLLGFIRSLPHSLISANNTNAISTTLGQDFGTSGLISIDKQLKPLLVKEYENLTAFHPGRCNTPEICPVLWRSLSNMVPNLGIIGNVSKTIGILILQGDNDSLTPVQEAFLLQQRLTEVNHPDHTLITYPNLGHAFYPSSQWLTAFGPVPQYVLADPYSWLAAHSGFTSSAGSSVTTNATTTMQSSPNSTASR